MSDSLLPFLDPETPAAPLPKQAGLSDPSIELLEDGMTVEPYLLAVREAGEVLDAIRVLACVLPPAVAVDWCRATVLEAYPDGSSKHAAGLMATVDAWVADPEDDGLRRAAMEAAEASEYTGPESWVAAAVGWSGGSIAPPHVEMVPPPPGLAGRAAGGAIVMAVVRDPAKTIPTAEAALEVGLALAAEVPMPVPAREGESGAAEAPVEIRSLNRPVGEAVPSADGRGPDPEAKPRGLRVQSLRRRSDPGAGS